MTTTAIVTSEIERFLKSTDPEVLCITGEWGVGKTYTWQTVLDRMRSRKETGLHRYSYVSLFGVNSLEALKASVFEHLEFLSPQGRTVLDTLKAGAKYASGQHPRQARWSATKCSGGNGGLGLLVRLPIPGKQVGDFVGGVIWKPGQHVSEPGLRIDVVHLAGLCRLPNYAESACFPGIHRERRVIGSA